MITLTGLTKQQVAYADLLWACETQEEVDAVVDTFGHECRVVHQLMLAALTDDAVANMQHFADVEKLLVDIRDR